MKKQTKHEKIIALYKQGMKPKDIAKKAKTTVQSVYAATCKYRKDVEKSKPKITINTGTVIHRPPPIGPMILEGLELSIFTKIKRFLFGV